MTKPASRRTSAAMTNGCRPSCQRLKRPAAGRVRLISGHVDLVVAVDLKVHDVMALVPVVQRASGIATLWSGDPSTDTFQRDILAGATPQLHSRAVRIFWRQLILPWSVHGSG